MTSLTATFTRQELAALKPTISELRLEALDAIRCGDYGRAVVLEQVVYRRLSEANEGEVIGA
jgi:hypothetical protein